VWRRSIVINVIGAFATGIVLIVVMISKFTAGGWLSLLFMVILVATFLTIHRHYTVVMRQLRRGAVRAGAIGVNHMVLVVRDLDAATAEALGAIRSIRPTELRIVHPVEEPDGDVPFELQDRWRAFAGGTSRLEPLPIGTGSLLDALRTYVARLNRAPEDFVNVVIPEIVQSSLLRYLLGRTQLVRLKAGLLREPNIVVTDVPVMVPDGRAFDRGCPPPHPRSHRRPRVRRIRERRGEASGELRGDARGIGDARDLLRARPRLGERDPGTMGGRRDADPARHRRGSVPGPDPPDVGGGPPVHARSRGPS
jgi:hypothetical protein